MDNLLIALALFAPVALLLLGLPPLFTFGRWARRRWRRRGDVIR